MKRIRIWAVLSIVITVCLCGCAMKENGESAPEQTVSAGLSENTGSVSEEMVSQDAVSENYVLKEGTIELFDYDSAAISQNLVKEATKQKLEIYLPPSYQTSEKRYPVVYVLHGFGDATGQFIKESKRVLDNAFSKDPSKEIIFVSVDGTNSAGGSYYVNSPVTGNWDDYTSKEIVEYVDTNYRTIASSDSRGICGFSMGGFGAINLAFLHPDVYGATYAMSPGVVAPGKFESAYDSWKGDYIFLSAYSMAFAYNTEKPFITQPKRDGSPEDNELLKRWETGYGNWEEKVDAYLAKGKPLRAIGLSYGTGDGYPWIPEGTQYLSGLLADKGTENTLFPFNGGHTIPPKAMEEHLLPFFREALLWE